MINLHNNKIWFCPLAFYHVYANTKGTYKVCCLAENSPHNVEDTSIEEWFNSDYLNDIRKHMLTKNVDMSKLSDCQRCINQEKVQGRSGRTEALDRLDLPKLSKIIQNFKETNEYVVDERVLEIKLKMFGNKCNLDCYMCYPHSSTTRQATMKKISTYIKAFSEDITTQISKDKMNELIQQVKQLKQYVNSIVIIGGEPLLMDDHYALLDDLVETGDSKDITLYYQSNLTLLQHNNKNFLEYVDKFKNIQIGVSIDGSHKYNDYLRMNSNFETVHNNIKYLKNFNNVVICMATTISLLSVLRYNFLMAYAAKEEIGINEMILDDPDCLHIRHLPDEIKRKLKILYKNKPNILNELSRDRDETQFQTAMKYCIERDKIHGTDVFDLFPELKDYVDENIING